MKNRLLAVFVLLGCMIGYASNAVGALTTEQLRQQRSKLKKITQQPLPASQPPAAKAAKAASPVAQKPQAPTPAASKKASTPEEERYTLLVNIGKYYNYKTLEKLNFDKANKLATDEINPYFLKHLQEITHDSPTTELLRIFVKGIILSSAYQAYAIADNILKLALAQKKDSAQKAIEIAEEIMQQNKDHLPSIEVLTALSKALPEKDKDRALNLPRDVQKSLNASNREIFEEYKKINEKITAEKEKAKAATLAVATKKKPEPTSTKGGASLTEQVQQVVKAQPPAAPTVQPSPRPLSPSPEDLQKRKRSLTPVSPKVETEKELKKAIDVQGEVKQKGLLKELKRKETNNTITEDEKSILKRLKEFYPETPKSPVVQQPPSEQKKGDLAGVLGSMIKTPKEKLEEEQQALIAERDNPATSQQRKAEINTRLDRIIKEILNIREQVQKPEESEEEEWSDEEK